MKALEFFQNGLQQDKKLYSISIVDYIENIMKETLNMHKQWDSNFIIVIKTCKNFLFAMSATT